MAGSRRRTKWQFSPFLIDQFHDLPRCTTQFHIDLRFVVPVDSTHHEFRAATDETLVFITPFDEFGVAAGLFCNLLACHAFNSFAAASAFCTSRSW